MTDFGYDIYASAREEYRKKIAEQAVEIKRLRDALETVFDDFGYTFPLDTKDMIRAALEGPQDRMAKPLEDRT